MSNVATWLYFTPVAIIMIAVAIPNHIRTGDRRYDMWETVRMIVTLGSFWFIVFAAIFRMCWGSGGSRDEKNQRAGPRGFDVLPPATNSLADDGGSEKVRDVYPANQMEARYSRRSYHHLKRSGRPSSPRGRK